jgi:predicted nucleic acid-binding protein
MPGRWPPLLIDANVLIDFADSDITVLRLASRHLAPMHVLRPVLREVVQLDATDYDRLDLTLFEPTVEQLLAAGSRRRSLSFFDRLCLIVAREQGWACVTNDTALRKECGIESVQAVWGLEVLVGLVEARQLGKDSALSIATKIHDNNPRHITLAILSRLEQRLRSRS